MNSTADLVTNSVADLTGKKNDTICQRVKAKLSRVTEIVTVEPLIGSYVMAAILCAPMIINLEYEKTCRVNLALNDTVCENILSGNIDNITEVNDEIQKLINNMHSWVQPVQSVMPLILVLFLGSFSDRHKWRKPFLILPIFGEFFSVIGCILCVLFMRSWPLEALGVFQSVIPSFFGGQTMIVMAVYAYIADVSTLEMRTLRIGIVQIVLNVIYPLTQLYSALLFELAGYYVILLLAGGLYVFGFLYGIFYVKEPREAILESKGNIVRDMFNPKHAVDTFNLVIKQKEGNNRQYIWLVLVTILIYSGVVVGETSVFYYYVNKQFKWGIVEYGYFSTVNTLVHLIGTAVAIPLFTKVLHLSDTTILLLTFIDKILCNLIFQFAKTNTLLYAAVFVSFITGVTGVGIRSLATKIVSENDLGKAQSLFGICEAIAPAVAIPLYSKAIYNNTLTTFPAAFFTFGIILYLLCCIFIGWMSINEKITKSRKTNQKETEHNGNDIRLDALDPAQTTHL